MNCALEERSEAQCEPADRLSSGHPGRAASSISPSVHVADVGVVGAISLPPWFSCRQARAVLQLKARGFALISGARGVDRVASLQRIAAAPPDQSVTAVAGPLGPPVTSSTPLLDAVRMMDAAAIDHAVLTTEGVVLGILLRAEAARALAALPSSRRRSHRRRESDRRAGARAFPAAVRVEDARDVANEHLAERREVQPAGVEVEVNQPVALEAA